MNLTEAAVATLSLTIFTTVSLQSFTSSMNVVSGSKLRDQVSSAISSDLAEVRKIVHLWQIDETTINDNDITIAGELNYCEKDPTDPTDPGCDIMCANDTMALSLLQSNLFSDNQYGALTTTADDSRRVNSDILANDETITDPNITLSRTLISEDSNNNLLKVEYSTGSSKLTQSNQIAYLVMPAQSWCP